MIDRESVITHLQIIHTWAAFARKRDLQFFTAKHLEDIAQWTDDALSLLKDQQQEIWELQDQVEYLTDKQKEQEEIVRCISCTFYRSDGECALHNGKWRPEGFCSWAIRKEGR